MSHDNTGCDALQPESKVEKIVEGATVHEGSQPYGQNGCQHSDGIVSMVEATAVGEPAPANGNVTEAAKRQAIAAKIKNQGYLTARPMVKVNVDVVHDHFRTDFDRSPEPLQNIMRGGPCT